MENTAKSIICQQLKQGLTVFAEVAANAALHATLAEAAEITANAMKHGRKLMVAGNGGSELMHNTLLPNSSADLRRNDLHCAPLLSPPTLRF